MSIFFTNSVYNTAKFKVANTKISKNGISNNYDAKNDNKSVKGAENSIFQTEAKNFIELTLSNNQEMSGYGAKAEKLSKSLNKMEMFQERLEREKENMRLAEIDGKLKSGAELKEEDLEYLKEHKPELYQEAIKIKREREEYKKQLERCRTKEKVEKLQKLKMDTFMGRIKAIQSANIPKEKKLIELDKVTREMAGITAEYKAFKKTEKFKSMPEKKDNDVVSKAIDEIEAKRRKQDEFNI